MRALEQMAAALSGHSPWSFAKPEQPEPRPVSKTDRMRQYLRSEGPANCHTLAMEAEVISTSLVGSLLAGDIEKGRVFFKQGKYHWNPDYDEQLQADIRSATALLQRHGYKVKKP